MMIKLYIVLIIFAVFLGFNGITVLSIIPLAYLSVLIIFVERLDDVKEMYFSNPMGPTIFITFSLIGMAVIKLIAYFSGYGLKFLIN